MADVKLTWHKVAGKDELPEGRVQTVTLTLGDSVHQICLTRHGGEYGALDNKCPHQGGPLGEGSIENGCLRCPWHGWDFDPITGKPPGGYDDGVETFAVEQRDDGVYVGIEEEMPHERTVTDVMAETMTNWGVTHTFGMVGHSNLGLADAIRRRCEAGALEYIGIRHEGAAAFAGSAFGKVTGRPASCLTIAGPGATNLLTGLWDAKVDRAPILALTGQVDQQVFGPGAFQELPLKEAFSAVAAFSHLALPGSRHSELMGLAVKHAVVERDVAHIIFPDDVQTVPSDAPAGSPEGRVAASEIRPPESELTRATGMLRGALRPVIIVGHGARFEMEAIVALAEELRCPVLTTFKGKGVIADHPRHPLGCGVLGRSGTPIASWFMNEADLLLVFGASFSNHTGITPKKPTIQVDFDRMQLGRFHGVDVPVWGETRRDRAGDDRRRPREAQVDRSIQREEIAERWTIWREEKRSRLAERPRRGREFRRGVRGAEQDRPRQRASSRSTSATTPTASGATSKRAASKRADVGLPRFDRFRLSRRDRVRGRRRGRTSSTRILIAEGFADRSVVCVTGDGGFGQYPWEVNTAVKYGMNITHVLLNNNELGKISKEQQAGDWAVWQTALSNPNIAEYVRSCGGSGIRVTEAGGLVDAINEALAYDGPATVEVMTDTALI